MNDEVNESKRAAEKRQAIFSINKKLQERPSNLVRACYFKHKNIIYIVLII